MLRPHFLPGLGAVAVPPGGRTGQELHKTLSMRFKRPPARRPPAVGARPVAAGVRRSAEQRAVEESDSLTASSACRRPRSSSAPQAASLSRLLAAGTDGADGQALDEGPPHGTGRSQAPSGHSLARLMLFSMPSPSPVPPFLPPVPASSPPKTSVLRTKEHITLRYMLRTLNRSSFLALGSTTDDHRFLGSSFLRREPIDFVDV